MMGESWAEMLFVNEWRFRDVDYEAERVAWSSIARYGMAWRLVLLRLGRSKWVLRVG